MTETVRFRGDWTFVVLAACVLGVLALTYAALNEPFLLSLSEQRRASWLALLTVFESGGVNWAILALVFYLLFESRKPLQKWRNPVAVRLLDDRLVFHKSLDQEPVPLEQVIDASYASGLVKSDLNLKLVSGRSVRIRNVDDCDGQGFAKQVIASRVSAASALAGQSGSPGQ